MLPEHESGGSGGGVVYGRCFFAPGRRPREAITARPGLPPHLIVAAAPGVQLLPRLPRDLRQSPLVGRVDVLVP